MMNRLERTMDRVLTQSLLIQDGTYLNLFFSAKGEKYFSCRQNYGVFVRPEKLKVGDYPVEELELEDEEM